MHTLTCNGCGKELARHRNPEVIEQLKRLPRVHRCDPKALPPQPAMRAPRVPPHLELARRRLVKGVMQRIPARRD
jgi:hypothetical protein